MGLSSGYQLTAAKAYAPLAGTREFGDIVNIGYLSFLIKNEAVGHGSEVPVDSIRIASQAIGLDYSYSSW